MNIIEVFTAEQNAAEILSGDGLTGLKLIKKGAVRGFAELEYPEFFGSNPNVIVKEYGASSRYYSFWDGVKMHKIPNMAAVVSSVHKNSSCHRAGREIKEIKGGWIVD